MFTNENEILKGCLRKDPTAQACLYDRYKARLMGICRRYARTTFEAEDIFQEAFLKIFEQIHQLNDEKLLSNWMKKVTVNIAISHYRKYAKHQQETEFDPNFELISDDHIIYLSQLDTTTLMNLIGELPEGCRLIFNMHVIDDFTHFEISKQLNISESTSKSQFVRAKVLLKKKVELMGFKIEQ